jgi:hypothetical protein
MTNSQVDPTLVAEGRALLQQEGNLNWKWADLVARVMPPGTADRDVLVEWATEIGWLETGRTVATLLSFRTVALAWPAERRCQGASFTAHAELAAEPNRFDLIRPGMTKRQARVVAGKKPEIGSKEARGQVVADLLTDPTVLRELASNPEYAKALREASVEVTDRMLATANEDRSERAPDLHRADAAYSMLAHLARARREVVSAVQRAAEVDLREGHILEGRRRAEQVRNAAELAVAFFDGKVTTASLEEQVASWAEDER